MSRHPDTDYLYISMRLKSMERNMLTREKLGRLASAKTDDEAVKLLVENGWGEFDPRDMSSLEEQIDAQRKNVLDLLYAYAPDRLVIDMFRLKYDYHNLKALVKAQATGEDAAPLLSGAASVSPQKIQVIFREKTYHELDETMREALLESLDLLARTGDPQLSDVLLDRAMFAHMLAFAEKTESAFLLGYIRLSIDLANLRVVTRATKWQKGFDYLRRAVSPGGTVPPDRLYTEITPEAVQIIFAGKELSAAASAAASALLGGGIAEMDMACDNTLIRYLHSARLISFGDPKVIIYLIAREAEFVSVRTIMAARAAGLPEDKIMERLRVSYV